MKAQATIDRLLESAGERIMQFLATSKEAQQYATSLKDVRELELPWKHELSKSGHGITVGGYAYYPQNKALTKWRASDGSDISNTSVAGMFYDYGGPDSFMDFLRSFPEDAEHLIIKKKVDQQDYEGGVLRGDHY
jgi:hypothetical protein